MDMQFSGCETLLILAALKVLTLSLMNLARSQVGLLMMMAALPVLFLLRILRCVLSFAIIIPLLVAVTNLAGGKPNVKCILITASQLSTAIRTPRSVFAIYV